MNTGAGTPTIGASTPTPQPESQKTVVRSGGGQTWHDDTLLDWDPAHFRLFVGNLAGEVTDESLLKAFSRYTSVQKARVIREKRTQKSKGFGFISFSNGDDYFKAGREMQHKYIGSHPILLRRANTEIRPEAPGKGKKHGGGNKSGNTGGKVKKDGVKKSGKTKGGLKILG
jgi:RNA recognition motif-containing protein